MGRGLDNEMLPENYVDVIEPNYSDGGYLVLISYTDDLLLPLINGAAWDMAGNETRKYVIAEVADLESTTELRDNVLALGFSIGKSDVKTNAAWALFRDRGSFLQGYDVVVRGCLAEAIDNVIGQAILGKGPLKIEVPIWASG